MNLLLANLDPADVAFLTQIAILDNLHPALCSAVAPNRGHAAGEAVGFVGVHGRR